VTSINPVSRVSEEGPLAKAARTVEVTGSAAETRSTLGTGGALALAFTSRRTASRQRERAISS
jgi:hypothetical protein